MGRLHPHPGTRSQRRIHNQLGIPRAGSAQRLRDILYLPVRRAGFLPVNRKGNLLVFRIALHINGSAVIVPYLQILDRTCDRRVHRRFHIGHNHGMILALHDLKLCLQSRIVQSCGNLAHAAADAVNHLAVGIGGCPFVSVGGGKRLKALVSGENLPGHQNPAVDLRCAHRHIGGTRGTAGAEGGSGCPQHILDGRQILCRDFRLRLHNHCLHTNRLIQPLGQGLVQRFARSLGIHRFSRYRFCNYKSAVLPGDGCILGRCPHILALGIDKLGHTGGSHSHFQGKIHRAFSQIFLCHVLADQAASRVLRGRLIHYLLIGPVVSQLSGRGLHIPALHAQGNFMLSLAADIGFDRIPGFLRRHPGKALSVHGNPFREYRFPIGRKGKSP